MKSKEYNPLEKDNLGASVVAALEVRRPQPLKSMEKFEGAGIYALYYVGDFPAYEKLSKANIKRIGAWPIYVGKAVPEGARKGLTSESTSELHKRIKEHGVSIQSSRNLNIEDFYFRYLSVDDIWIPLSESLMIRKFQPVWNVKLDGFGNHAPGSGRKGTIMSLWDTLHPGRGWAKKLTKRNDSIDDIGERVIKHLDETIR